MDTLVETPHDKFWRPDAFQRDQFVKAEAAKLPPGSRVLDAGAGASKYRPFFAHCQYESQDFCQYQGSLVKYTRPIDHVCEITQIPLPAQSLDAIVCTEVLEHVVHPMEVLGEFSRLLKPGGKLLLTTPLGCWIHMEPYHYYGGYTPYWFEHWLPKHGLRLESIVPQGGPGRVVAIALERFYTLLRVHEPRQRFLARLGSKSLRLLLRFPVYYLMPWLATRLDPGLDGYRVAGGYLVVATRATGTDPFDLKSRATWSMAS